MESSGYPKYEWISRSISVISSYSSFLQHGLEKMDSALPWAKILSTTLVILVTAYIAFAINVYKVHEEEFAGKRVKRNDAKSETSHTMNPPKVKHWMDNQLKILSNAENYENNFKSFHLLRNVKEANHSGKNYFSKMSRQSHIRSSRKEDAKVLNMDHVYLSFTQLLWAFTFVGPFAYLLWRKAVMMLRFRVFLHKHGLIKKKDVDVRSLVAKLILEQSQAIHYFAMDDDEDKQGEEAGFFFNDFPYIDEDGEMEIADIFAVHIDLNTKKMVKAKLDDENLTPNQALILLWYNTISAQHVKLHAYGNWGVNCDAATKELNPNLYLNSLVTVVYNYFGFSSFARFMETWKKQGLLSPDWNPDALVSTFSHGVEEGVWEHAHIVEIAKYSRFVSFIMKARISFHAEFVKYKHLFPGVNAEGLFVGTVMHSLDHALMDWNLEDPLWLDVDDPKYGKMAELGRIVKVGFVPEVEGYYFNRKWKNSGHPFYEAVYQKLYKLDAKFADAMDTCICR